MPNRTRTSRRHVQPAIEILEGRKLLSAAALRSALAPVPVAHPTFQLAHHGSVRPAATAGATGFTPAQIRHAYGLDSVSFSGVAGDGSGQTIAIIDAYDDPNAASDLHNFDTAFGLADPPSFTRLNEDGGTALPATDSAAKPNTWELEESLDFEWAHVMAPKANLILYEANSSSYDDLVAHGVNSARNNPSVSVVTMSFGAGEFVGESTYDSYFTTPAGHQGISFFASTGDSGSPGSYPAYSPKVVAVGGTTLALDSSGNYASETGWSGSGGGSGTQEAEPAYQNSVQNTGVRSIPDVSIDADPNSGVPVYDSYDNGAATPWMQMGGTSLASPMWAGIVAVADQGRVRYGAGSLDGATQLLPTLYQLPSSDFHDVTSGSNGAFSAGPGYDEVTGRGTPIANLLIPALAPAPATASTASFVRADATTSGSWTNTYGADGYSVISGTTSYPSYAQVAVTGQQTWTWGATTDPRATQTSAGSTSRIAACNYSNGSFTYDVNLTDSQSHQVALYMLDWDSTLRTQSITVADANTGAVLDTRSVSNFHNGQYLVWNLSGHVKITLTHTAGANAVASGIFFGAGRRSTASFVRADTTTAGTWTGAYGADGYTVIGGSTSYPSYAQVTASGQQSWIWGASTDPRATQTSPGSASRIAGCYYSPGSFTLDVNLTDGAAHQVALYMLDWDSTLRTQTVTVADANTGATLDTRTAAAFHNGVYFVWNLSGHVKITLTRTGGANAVASALLFG